MRTPTGPGHPRAQCGELGCAGGSTATRHRPRRSLAVTVDTKAQRTQQDGPDVLLSPEPLGPVGGVWPGGTCQALRCGRTRSSHSASERMPACECTRQTGLKPGPRGELGRGRGPRARCASVEALQGLPPPACSLRFWGGPDSAAASGRGAGGAERLAARGVLLPYGSCFGQEPCLPGRLLHQLLNGRINT